MNCQNELCNELRKFAAKPLGDITSQNEFCNELWKFGAKPLGDIKCQNEFCNELRKLVAKPLGDIKCQNEFWNELRKFFAKPLGDTKCQTELCNELRKFVAKPLGVMKYQNESCNELRKFFAKPWVSTSCYLGFATSFGSPLQNPGCKKVAYWTLQPTCEVRCKTLGDTKCQNEFCNNGLWKFVAKPWVINVREIQRGVNK